MKIQDLGRLNEEWKDWRATAPLKRSEAVAYVKVARGRDNLTWSAVASATGIPKTTLRRWVLEDERSAEGHIRFTWTGALLVTLLIMATPVILLGMVVGTCYLLGGHEEALFVLGVFKKGILGR